jgi:hypothetical protein
MDCEEELELEEEFQAQPHPSLTFAFQKEERYDCYTLVVAQEGPPALFAHSLIGPVTIANRLNFSKAKQAALADLYVDKDEKLLYLIFNDVLPPMQEIHFVQFLERSIKCERIILLLSVPRNTLENTSIPPLTVGLSLFSVCRQVRWRRWSLCRDLRRG